MTEPEAKQFDISLLEQGNDAHAPLVVNTVCAVMPASEAANCWDWYCELAA